MKNKNKGNYTIYKTKDIIWKLLHISKPVEYYMFPF